MIHKDELMELSEVDIRAVNPDELVDINTVSISNSFSKEERIEDYIEQIKNPYLFKSNGVIVKLCFNNDGNSLQECLEKLLSIEIGGVQSTNTNDELPKAM